MIWWCKIRAVPVLAASTTGTVLVGLVAGNVELPIPVLTGQSGQFLLAHLMTLLPAVTLLYGLGRADRQTEGVAARRVRIWDAGLGLAVATGGALTAAACYFMLDLELALVLGRNIAGYTGIALLLFPALGPPVTGGVLAAIPLVLAAGGWRPGGSPQPWAWLLHPADSALAFLAAIVLLTGGAATAALWSRPPLTIAAQP
ncbi:hypothetical protein [Streptomyces hydrogenans]|uniref:hypothetical protein n=1 Tax=Streptomyces hydrogenans TaxID=1873719 RepID=UPI00368A7FBC